MSGNKKVKPIEGIITTTYRCNAKCKMCNIWKNPSDPEKEWKPADLDSIPYGLKNLNITGGEPFLRKDLKDIIRVLRPKTKRMVISTNGYFTERMLSVAREFPEVGYRISIEGLPAANDELRGLKDGFDHGLRSLLKLNEMGVEDIGFGITVSDRNAKDLLELYELADMMDVEFATAVVHNSFYFHKRDNEVVDKDLVIQEFEKLIDKLLSTRKVKNWYRAYFNAGIINRLKGGARPLPCKMGTDLFFLSPYGDIKPCNGMDYKIGNIKERDFMDIWNSPKAEKMREAVRKCDKQCWMIGSASPAMKENFWEVTKWVMKSKLKGKKMPIGVEKD